MLRARSSFAAATRRFSTQHEHAARMRLLVNEFRSAGHLHANVNPLTSPPAALVPRLFGLNEDDEVTADVLRDVAPGLGKALNKLQAVRVRDVVSQLRRTYCDTTSVEYDCMNVEEKEWLAEQIESSSRADFARVDDERRYGELISRSQAFDLYVHKKMRFVKRYGLEGGESMIVATDSLFRACARTTIGDVVIAMPHRGRSNLLAVLLKFPPASLFAKMRGESLLPRDVLGDDDVLSHIAQSVELDAQYGAPLRVSLIHNPSHLEAAAPVALGKARARQDAKVGRDERAAAPRAAHSLPLVMHGDAAVAGQGIVYETSLLAKLPGYSTGGSVHLVVNNQLGFTTPLGEARSSRYATDIAKVNGAPVLRVNAEDAPAVARAADIAVRYRRTFGADVWIDMLCYRRHGHNELDDPMFTQPTMYNDIAARASFAELYANDLAKRGIWSAEARKEMLAAYNASLEREYESVGTAAFVPHTSTHAGANWAAMAQGTLSTMSKALTTGVDQPQLLRVGEASVALPNAVGPAISVHPRLQKGHCDARRKMLGDGVVDWATAEALAFGSLMLDGFDVRLSGQDAQRGTFSHRHATLSCQKTGARVCPLDENLRAPNVGRFEVYNSPLSEAAVMAFDYGYSLQQPKTLVLWEAQFGDFANSAQVTIDQFVANGEHKWLRQSGLVLLLPHGYDGAGPEHSSARIERFLQLSNEPFERIAHNDDALDASTVGPHTHLPSIVVANPTTPANYFHLLRRQCLWPFRKPLVIIAPKALLRLAEAVSPLTALGPEAHFSPVIVDEVVADHATEVLLCSGKIYYDLLAARKQRHGDKSTTAIVRVEQLTPLPYDELAHALNYNGAPRRVRWVQEEPQNQGAWSFIKPRFDAAFGSVCDPLEYVGPQALPMSATGIKKLHDEYFKAIIDAALPN